MMTSMQSHLEVECLSISLIPGQPTVLWIADSQPLLNLCNHGKLCVPVLSVLRSVRNKRVEAEDSRTGCTPILA